MRKLISWLLFCPAPVCSPRDRKHPCLALWLILQLDEGVDMKSSLAIKMQYEPASTRFPHGPLAAFAEETYRLALTNPLAIPMSIAGQSSRVSSGILIPQAALNDYRPIRLKGIFLEGVPLVLRSYDEFGRLNSVEYPDGQPITYAYGDDGKPDRVSVGTSTRIERMRDGVGNLIEVKYDAGIGKLTMKRAVNGRVQSISTGNDGLSWVWEGGRIASVRFADGSSMEVHVPENASPGKLTFTEDESVSKFAMQTGVYSIAKSETAGLSRIFSPLGIMRVDTKGRVSFWLQPDGIPMWFDYDQENRISRIWSLSGVTVCKHNETPRFSIINSAGNRFLFHEVAKDCFALIGPETISLVSRARALGTGNVGRLCPVWIRGDEQIECAHQDSLTTNG